MGRSANLAKFFGIDPAHVIAVHDEIDIPFDTVKLKLGGGEGGHNGLRDISKALGTKDYLRVRVGVGRPPGPHGNRGLRARRTSRRTRKKTFPS